MKNEGIRFGTIRKYCSRIDRGSICMQETLQYFSYRGGELGRCAYPWSFRLRRIRKQSRGSEGHFFCGAGRVSKMRRKYF